MNKFKILDKKGQGVAMQFLTAMFSAQTINVQQHWADSGKVDIHLTATTKSDNEYYYCIECKHRDYKHNQFKDGWIIEKHKKKSLNEDINKKYKPIYLNTFRDGYCLVWDLTKIDWKKCGETGTKEFFNTEVERDEKKKHRENKITLLNNQAVWQGKLKNGKVEKVTDENLN